MEWYPFFVEHIIEVKRYVARVCAYEQPGSSTIRYEEREDLREIELAEGYKLEMRADDDHVYCLALKENGQWQTLYERKQLINQFGYGLKLY